MDRVLDRLWIGSSADLDARMPLRHLGFSAVVDLRERGGESDDLPIHRIPNRDGDAWSAEDVQGAMVFIHEHVLRGRVLVACAAGMSRSVSMVIGYLVRSGWGVAEAFRHVKSVRPVATPDVRMFGAVLKVVDVANVPESVTGLLKSVVK